MAIAVAAAAMCVAIVAACSPTSTSTDAGLIQTAESAQTNVPVPPLSSPTSDDGTTADLGNPTNPSGPQSSGSSVGSVAPPALGLDLGKYSLIPEGNRYPVPGVELVTVDNEPFPLDDQIGKVVLVYQTEF